MLAASPRIRARCFGLHILGPGLLTSEGIRGLLTSSEEGILGLTCGLGDQGREAAGQSRAASGLVRAPGERRGDDNNQASIILLMMNSHLLLQRILARAVLLGGILAGAGVTGLHPRLWLRWP